MIIGVGAVITMVALGTRRAGDDRRAGQGGRHQHDQHQRRQLHRRAASGRARATSTTLMPEDAHGAARRARRAVRRRGRRTRRAQVIAGNQNWSTQIQGTDVDLPLIRSWPTKYGAFFTPAGRQQRGQGRGARHGRRRHAVRRGRRSDRPDHPHPQPAVQGDRRDGAARASRRDRAGSGRRDLRALHDGAEEAAGHQHINNITVSAPIADTAPVAAAIEQALRTAPQAHRPAIPTTSWSARWKRWPASAPRRPRR